MKVLALLTLSCTTTLCSLTQQPLYFISGNLYDEKLIAADAVNAVLTRAIRHYCDSTGLSQVYTPVVVNDHKVQAGDHYVKMVSSYQFLSDSQQLSIPAFIVHKRNWQTPYYYSYFIARKNSTFNSFNDFKNVKTIVLQKGSMSGYYSPLYKLWELNLIKNPSVKSLKDELHKNVKELDNPKQVIDAVSADEHSIGATGVEAYDNPNVEIKVINHVLPQDVICLSTSLGQHEQRVRALVQHLFDNRKMTDSLHFVVSQVREFSQAYRNSYAYNQQIINVVDSTKNKFDTQVFLRRMIPESNQKITLGELWLFLGKASWGVYLGNKKSSPVVYHLFSLHLSKSFQQSSVLKLTLQISFRYLC